jgi:hypothetical protein
LSRKNAAASKSGQLDHCTGPTAPIQNQLLLERGKHIPLPAWMTTVTLQAEDRPQRHPLDCSDTSDGQTRWRSDRRPLPVGRLACATGAVGVRPYVEYDVVRMGRICHAFNASELIETEGISDPPSDHVIGAGSVTADADAAYFDAVPIKRKTAAEYVHTADALANHGIVRRAERSTMRSELGGHLLT